MDNMKSTYEFQSGLRASIPIILGYLPIGIAYGMMARQAGMTVGQTVSMSIFVYTGAAQMASTQMVRTGAGLFAILVTTFIMNLRHIVMSACVMEKMKTGNKIQRTLLSFLITDETFAVYMSNPESRPTWRFFLGLGIGSYSSWIIASLLGAVGANILPDSLSSGMSVALYAMFIALLIPSVKNNRSLLLLVGLTAGISGILSLFLSAGVVMILSALLGAGIGLWFVDEGELR